MIILLGPVHPYRGGGITSFNERLLKELQAEGHEVMAYNFTLLYPDFLFPGKSQMADHAVDLPFPAPRLVNAMNPLNWIKVALARSLPGNDLKTEAQGLQSGLHSRQCNSPRETAWRQAFHAIFCKAGVFFYHHE
jgi:hypothetical protein